MVKRKMIKVKRKEKRRRLKSPIRKVVRREKKALVKKGISAKKQKKKSQLAELIRKSRTIMICYTLNIPSSQFQKIRRKLKDNAEMHVVKKRIMIRALDEVKEEKKGIEELEKNLEKSSAVLFSDRDPYELAGILADNKTRAKAKAGQIAQCDVEIEAGPTDLMPGPVITELANLRIKAGVEHGKIAIKENKKILKQGEKVKADVASILNKLEIIPFRIGLEAVAAYDSKEKKIFVGIVIDKEEAEKNLALGASEARSLAVFINYVCRETLPELISRVGSEAEALQASLPQQKAEEKKEEVKPEEKKEEKKENTQ